MTPPSPRWPPGTLLNGLTNHQQSELVGLGSPRWFDVGETLIQEGESRRTVFLLLSGRAKVQSVDTSGHVTLLAVRLEGDIVGELAALDGGPRAASVVAAAWTAVRVVDGSDFVAHLTDRPAVAEAVRRYVVGKLREATRRRADLGTSSVLVRLARVLVQLGRRYGQPLPQGVLVDVRLSQADLATLINAGEKSVHRALAELRDRGLVLTGGRRQLLLRDIDGLAIVAGELPCPGSK